MCTGVGCLQELVGRPMYTELVEGENGKVQPQDSSAAAAVGIKKLLIDVSDISFVKFFCYCPLVFLHNFTILCTFHHHLKTHYLTHFSAPT